MKFMIIVKALETETVTVVAKNVEHSLMKLIFTAVSRSQRATIGVRRKISVRIRNNTLLVLICVTDVV